MRQAGREQSHESDQRAQCGSPGRMAPLTGEEGKGREGGREGEGKGEGKCSQFSTGPGHNGINALSHMET